VHVSVVEVLTDGLPSTVDHQVTNYSLVTVIPRFFSLSLLYTRHMLDVFLALRK